MELRLFVISLICIKIYKIDFQLTIIVQLHIGLVIKSSMLNSGPNVLLDCKISPHYLTIINSRKQEVCLSFG